MSGPAAREQRRGERRRRIARRQITAVAAVSAALAGAVIAFAAGGEPASPDPYRVAASKLTTKQLAGQRIVASYSGLKPPKQLLKMIKRGRVAGVIFFTPNIESRSQLRAVSRRLQRAARRASVPAALRRELLLMVDQEGGLVRRLPGAPRRSQAEVGAADDPSAAARKAGRAAAANLERAGLNVNLAPVLGVARSSRGTLAATGRTYGRAPGKVGRLAAAFISAQQRKGVAATAKHFPGLGAAGSNTDDAEVVIGTSRARLRRTDIAPYERAIEAGTKLVMLANATYRALDRRRPAGLSRRVIGGELRKRLGYEGVTITDALEAAGLGRYGSLPKLGLRAARAGSDLLLFSGQDTDDAKRGWKRIHKAIGDDKIGREAAVGAAARVLRLRDSL